MCNRSVGESWGWETDHSLNLVRLVQHRTMDAASGALLWLCASHRLPFLVAGGPRQIGKSTLAAAYRDALPADTALAYTKGMMEDFAWVGKTEPERTVVLVSEFSNHTPMYLYGESAQRVFQLAARDGYKIVGTLHAESAQEALEVLVEEAAIQPDLAAVIDIVAVLTVKVSQSQTLGGLRGPPTYERRLNEIAVVLPKGNNLPDVVPLVTYDRRYDAYALNADRSALAVLAGTLEMTPDAVSASWQRRRDTLTSLVESLTVNTATVIKKLQAEAWR